MNIIKKVIFYLLFLFLFFNLKAQESDFLIRKGDKISIQVMEHPEFTVSNITVLPDGCIQFPAVGSIKAAGVSADSLSRHLARVLDDYVVHPIVSIYVNKIENQSINIFGYLNKPGKYQIFEPVDLITALSLAGGVKNIRKKNKITIIRRDGSVEKYKLRRLLNRNREKLGNINKIAAGDTVLVKDPMKIEWGMLSLLVTLAHLIVVIV